MIERLIYFFCLISQLLLTNLKITIPIFSTSTLHAFLFTSHILLLSQFITAPTCTQQSYHHTNVTNHSSCVTDVTTVTTHYNLPAFLNLNYLRRTLKYLNTRRCGPTFIKDVRFIGFLQDASRNPSMELCTWIFWCKHPIGSVIPEFKHARKSLYLAKVTAKSSVHSEAVQQRTVGVTIVCENVKHEINETTSLRESRTGTETYMEKQHWVTEQLA